MLQVMVLKMNTSAPTTAGLFTALWMRTSALASEYRTAPEFSGIKGVTKKQFWKANFSQSLTSAVPGGRLAIQPIVLLLAFPIKRCRLVLR
mmetsp:Transcript_6061/g.7288  ORF Transcript_6061/g.7288 Transcript_6061/m.7288 type:complete len:91 (-) Transcript_6061:710-982(-)